MAVQELLAQEKGLLHVLAFSIGGSIAWKASLQGLKVEQLCCVSATRLRHETQKPDCAIQLFFGKEDTYQPKKQWFESMNVAHEIFNNQGHTLYSNPKMAVPICDFFL